MERPNRRLRLSQAAHLEQPNRFNNICGNKDNGHEDECSSHHVGKRHELNGIEGTRVFTAGKFGEGTL